MLEGIALRGEIGKVGDGEFIVIDAAARGAFPNFYEAIEIWERERIENEGVYDAENRGICADAERESEDGDGGVGGILAQSARGEFELVKDRPEHGGTLPWLYRRTRIGYVWFRACSSAEWDYWRSVESTNGAFWPLRTRDRQDRCLSCDSTGIYLADSG